MSDWNLKATEFVPSWLQKKPQATSPVPLTAPVATKHVSPQSLDNPIEKQSASPPATIPWKGIPQSSPGSKLSATATEFTPAPVAPQVAPKKAAPVKQQEAKPRDLKPNVLSKTVEELKEISQRSTLNISASAFIPRTVKGITISPLLLAQPEQPEDLLLADMWSLHYLDALASGQKDFDPARVFRVNCVSMFWKTMNNIPPPGGLETGATMFLFRDDIDPKWEDPKNANGGMWRLKVPSGKIDDIWLALCCRTIGESWEEEHRKAVNGIVLKVREKGFWVEIWVTEKLSQFPSDVSSAIGDFLPSFSIDYWEHAEIQKFQQEAEANAAANGKKKKKRK